MLNAEAISWQKTYLIYKDTLPFYHIVRRFANNLRFQPPVSGPETIPCFNIFCQQNHKSCMLLSGMYMICDL